MKRRSFLGALTLGASALAARLGIGEANCVVDNTPTQLKTTVREWRNSCGHQCIEIATTSALRNPETGTIITEVETQLHVYSVGAVSITTNKSRSFA